MRGARALAVAARQCCRAGQGGRPCPRRRRAAVLPRGAGRQQIATSRADSPRMPPAMGTHCHHRLPGALGPYIATMEPYIATMEPYLPTMEPYHCNRGTLPCNHER